MRRGRSTPTRRPPSPRWRRAASTRSAPCFTARPGDALREGCPRAFRRGAQPAVAGPASVDAVHVISGGTVVLAAAAASLTLPPRYSVTGIMVSAATYASATVAVMAAARARRSLILSAARSTSSRSAPPIRSTERSSTSSSWWCRIGQPVRWALKLLHGVSLPDRVYGPTLMLRICEGAAKTGGASTCTAAAPRCSIDCARTSPSGSRA